MLDFALQLPTIREVVNQAISAKSISCEKVLAIIIALLEKTLIRIGNDNYVKNNNSFGLTTLRNRHVDVIGSDIKFQFRGKSGIQHQIQLRDRRISRLIWKLKDIPGQNLFQYLDDENAIHAVSSSDVNDYLKEITGKEYTAKDFRTWYGTFYTMLTLSAFPPFKDLNEAKKNVAEAIKETSKKLGNTPTICKKCYVHPLIIETYMAGEFVDLVESKRNLTTQEEILKVVELYVINLLKNKTGLIRVT